MLSLEPPDLKSLSASILLRRRSNPELWPGGTKISMTKHSVWWQIWRSRVNNFSKWVCWIFLWRSCWSWSCCWCWRYRDTCFSLFLFKKNPPLANLEQTFFAPLSKLSIEQIHSNSPKYKTQTRPKWDPKKRLSRSAVRQKPLLIRCPAFYSSKGIRTQIEIY